MKPPIPPNEKQRLQVLWQYDVLDTVPEEVFDDLTELAAHICEAPIALITLVDEHRQWFKSRYGLNLTETSRDISFCAHALLGEGLLIVPDATKDPRFADNPLVRAEPKIRFYAGAPLITPDGYALGTLCVIDNLPRSLRPDQEKALRLLSRLVMTQLELRRRSRELARARREETAAKAQLRNARTELLRARRELAAHKARLQRERARTR
jgi:GAF domain-containing protein